MRAVPLVMLMPLLLMAGCAGTSAPAREARFAAMVGDTEAELVQALGPPSFVDQAHRQRVLVWRRDYQEWVQASPFNQDPPELLGLDYNGMPPRLLRWSCQRQFTMVDGKAAAYRQSGNDC